jgi:hypothetical protein
MATSHPNELNQRYENELEETLLFNDEILAYFRTKLDDFDIQCLELVKEKSSTRGLRKNDLEEYKSKRKIYDNTFVRLEAQGLIRIIPDGTFRPYFITNRGEQMLSFNA